ncbi:MAG: HIT family protein [Planctomycetes bacterium]|nr:HIT family protein [Planctomycetota bacterium]
MNHAPECPLCTGPGGDVLWQDRECRVVLADEPHHPGTCRVILAEHVRELSDLAPARQQALLRVVVAVERALRTVLGPDKINLASLGNVVPHLHWHVIPRWRTDRCFPNAIWGGVQRPGEVPALDARTRTALLTAVAREASQA